MRLVCYHTTSCPLSLPLLTWSGLPLGSRAGHVDYYKYLYLSSVLRCVLFHQRYVARPMLWRERKFHFRVYALLRADMSAWLYRTAYILAASRPYSLGRSDDGRVGATAEVEGVRREGFADELIHISNLAVNKHTKGHPGQVSPHQAPLHLYVRCAVLLPCLQPAPLTWNPLLYTCFRTSFRRKDYSRAAYR